MAGGAKGVRRGAFLRAFLCASPGECTHSRECSSSLSPPRSLSPSLLSGVRVCLLDRAGGMAPSRPAEDHEGPGAAGGAGMDGAVPDAGAGEVVGAVAVASAAAAALPQQPASVSEKLVGFAQEYFRAIKSKYAGTTHLTHALRVAMVPFASPEGKISETATAFFPDNFNEREGRVSRNLRELVGEARKLRELVMDTGDLTVLAYKRPKPRGHSANAMKAKAEAGEVKPARKRPRKARAKKEEAPAAAPAPAPAEGPAAAAPPGGLSNLSGLLVKRVLSDGVSGADAEKKGLALLCSLGGRECIVKVRQTALPSTEEGARSLLAGTALTERMAYNGSEFGYYHGHPTASAPPLSVEVISTAGGPAGAALLQKHVDRSTSQEMRLYRETPQSYDRCHLPYIEAIPAGATSWVDAVVSLQKERESLLYSEGDADGDDGFTINVDPKWTAHPEMSGRDAASAVAGCADMGFTKQLYCLGIARDASVRSLRDLRAKHLPLLMRMREAGESIAGERYGVAPSQLRQFVHYPPQFYRFHWHVTHVNVHLGIETERAHLLDDIIDNLERDPEHYARANLTCRVGETDGLWRRVCSAGDEDEPVM